MKKEDLSYFLEDVMDLHTHTIVSGHAYGTINESVAAAKREGLKLLAITEHAPAMPRSCGKIYFDNIDLMPHDDQGLQVLYGVELNILDDYGRVDLMDHTLNYLDLAIASMHTPCYRDHGVSGNTKAYIYAMENPYVTIIGHPDDARFPVDYDELARQAVEHKVLLEMNSSSMDERSYRIGAGDLYRKMLASCVKYGAKIIVNSDAHVSSAVGNHQNAYEILKQEKFPEELVVNSDVERIKEYITFYKK